MQAKQQLGFTLIEVMIVVVIIGILAAIAYPSYSEYVKRGNRTEGQAFLMDVAARQERYFSQNNAYITKTTEISKLGLSSVDSPTGKYSLTVGTGGGGYILTVANNFNDTKCGNLTLNARGERGAVGTVDECWR